MEKLLEKHWPHLTIKKVTLLLESSRKKGLVFLKIKARQSLFGLNKLTAQSTTAPFKLFLLPFNQPLVYILMAAGFATLFLAEFVNSTVIFSAVFINAVIGFLQKSKTAMSILAKRQAIIRKLPPLEIYGSITMVLLLLLFAYLPIINLFFASAPIGVDSWLRIIAAGFIIFSVVALEKYVRQKQQLGLTSSPI